MSAGVVSASALVVAWGGLSWMTAIACGDVWGSKAGMLAPSLENFEPGPRGARFLNQMAYDFDLVFSRADLLCQVFDPLL